MQIDARSGIEDIEVLYADEAVVVLNKPAGLLSVPGRGPDKQDCLIRRVAHRFADVRVVHRLDMATSGLMVMARSLPSLRLLSRAFEQRRVHKRYIAVVDGCVEPTSEEWRTIDLPIRVDWPNRPRRIIEALNGQDSVTRLRILRIDSDLQHTRVELEPLTGRTHQLRVHLQAIGHPILGDALYAPDATRDKTRRLMLHAQELEFEHPLHGEALQFICPALF